MARSPIHVKPCCWAQFKRLMPLKPPSSRKHKSTGQAFCNSLFPVLSKLLIKILQELWRYSILIRSGVLRIHIFIHWGEIRTLYIESSISIPKDYESTQSYESSEKKNNMILKGWLWCCLSFGNMLGFLHSISVFLMEFQNDPVMHIGVFISKLKPDFFLKKQIGFS